MAWGFVLYRLDKPGQVESRLDTGSARGSEGRRLDRTTWLTTIPLVALVIAEIKLKV